MENQNVVKEVCLICKEPNKVYALYKHAAYSQYAHYRGDEDCIRQERENNTTLFRNSRGKPVLFVMNIEGQFIPHGFIKGRKNETNHTSLS